jgi:hypothetical protein
MLTPQRQHASVWIEVPQFGFVVKEYSHTITEFAVIGSRAHAVKVSKHLQAVYRAVDTSLAEDVAAMIGQIQQKAVTSQALEKDVEVNQFITGVRAA